MMNMGNKMKPVIKQIDVRQYMYIFLYYIYCS